MSESCKTKKRIFKSRRSKPYFKELRLSVYFFRARDTTLVLYRATELS